MKNKAKKMALLAVLAGSLTACGGGYVAYRSAGPPPPPQAYGPRGYAPGPGYVWVDGFYDWNGRYVWVPGQWRRPPRANAYWAPGRFEHHGRRQVWIKGGWRW